MQKEQKLGVGSNQQTLSAEHDLAVAESALVTAQTAYEKARIEVRRATGSVLEEYGISIADAKTGVVERTIAKWQTLSKNERIRVLVADDQPHILEAVELLLKPQGIQVDCVRSPQLLLEALGQSDYDVLLIDLNYTRDTTSGQEGLDLLARLQEIDPRLPVIVMTAWGNIDLAVESIKRGARDFIQKPWENERLISLIRVHAELHQALRRARQLELENRLLRAEGMPEFVAAAPSMQPVLELIAQVGPSDANVLITGEHGTGKEIVAKLLHAASPAQPHGRWSPSTPADLPEGTFESEIFGHVKGAFTDARTDRVGRFRTGQRRHALS